MTWVLEPKVGIGADKLEVAVGKLEKGKETTHFVAAEGMQKPVQTIHTSSDPVGLEGAFVKTLSLERLIGNTLFTDTATDAASLLYEAPSFAGAGKVPDAGDIALIGPYKVPELLQDSFTVDMAVAMTGALFNKKAVVPHVASPVVKHEPVKVHQLRAKMKGSLAFKGTLKDP